MSMNPKLTINRISLKQIKKAEHIKLNTILQAIIASTPIYRHLISQENFCKKKIEDFYCLTE